MNLFSELKPHIDAFKATREYVVSGVSLPEVDSDMSYGNPPYAIDDGTNYYAVIDKGGNVSPLPFGYQIPSNYLDMDSADCLLNVLMTVPAGGVDTARYVPLVEDFELPGERAFCLESAEDSSVWEAAGNVVEAMQQQVNERALFNFNQRLSNALVNLYEGVEELESVDQTVAALVTDPSVPIDFLLRSYRHALDRIEEEMNAEDDG